MGNELAKINFNDEKIIKTLQATVAKDASPEEFLMFSEFCKSTGLNPFKKEIWFIKTNGRVQMMTGINGFFAIANSNANYDGLECDIELDDKGVPVKAVAKAYRKDRKFPAVGIALLRESRGNSPVWNQQPSVMLSKVAKARALREAFPQEMGGLYTDDEMPTQFAAPTPRIEEVKPEEQPIDTTPHWYRLKDVPPAARRKAVLYAQESGAEMIDSTEMIYRSSGSLKKLVNYEIEEPVAEVAEPTEAEVTQEVGEQQA